MSFLILTYFYLIVQGYGARPKASNSWFKRRKPALQSRGRGNSVLNSLDRGKPALKLRKRRKPDLNPLDLLSGVDLLTGLIPFDSLDLLSGALPYIFDDGDQEGELDNDEDSSSYYSLPPFYRRVKNRDIFDFNVSTDELIEAAQTAYRSCVETSSIYSHKSSLSVKFDIDHDDVDDLLIKLRFDWSSVITPYITANNRQLSIDMFKNQDSILDKDREEYKVAWKRDHLPTFLSSQIPTFCDPSYSSPLPDLSLTEFSMSPLSEAGENYLLDVVEDGIIFPSISLGSSSLFNIGELQHNINQFNDDHDDPTVFWSLGMNHEFQCAMQRKNLPVRINFEFHPPMHWNDPRIKGDKALSFQPKYMKEICSEQLNDMCGLVMNNGVPAYKLTSHDIVDLADFDALLEILEEEDVVTLNADESEIFGAGSLESFQKFMYSGGRDKVIDTNGHDLYIVMKPLEPDVVMAIARSEAIQEFGWNAAKRIADYIVPVVGPKVATGIQKASDFYKNRYEYQQLIKYFGNSLNVAMGGWTSGNNALRRRATAEFGQRIARKLVKHYLKGPRTMRYTPKEPVHWQGFTIDGRGNPVFGMKLPMQFLVTTEPLDDEDYNNGYVSLHIADSEAGLFSFRNIGNTLTVFLRYLELQLSSSSTEEGLNVVDQLDTIDELISDLIGNLFTD